MNKKNSKTRSIVWSVLYLIIVIAMCFSGIVIFHRNYYSPVYIDGESMQPTLNNNLDPNIHDLGFVDTSLACLKNIEQFDIVTCYYPPPLSNEDYPNTYVPGAGIPPLASAEHKIKRVMAIPGQTFSIKNNVFYMYDSPEDETGEAIDLPFDIKTNPNKPRHVVKLTLKEDEYFVMGDNWVDSNDCSKYQKPIYKENIVGILIAIVGTCEVEVINGQNVIVNRKYHWPVFYK
jgi:signal peptidase I